MYRRRRPQREKIAFGFDSFLDVVANVIGVIIRLILVAWVGARAYHSAMVWVEEESTPSALPLSAPRAEDDPLHPRIAEAKRELDAMQARLQEYLRQLDGVHHQADAKRQLLAQLTSQRQALSEASQRLEQPPGAKAPTRPPPDLEELKRRSQELAKALETLAAAPAHKQILRYRAPVSRAVEGDELYFELKGGRAAYIDLPAFLQEIESKKAEVHEQLRAEWKVVGTTAPIGAFRLRYTRERALELGETATGKPRGLFYGSAYTGWEIEPVLKVRGETADDALKPGSAFRQLVDGLDPNFTVVTLWVYPDSFALYRRLRDFLQEHELEVAGRPLTMDHPIGASRYGSKSRGQ